jgi:hypothetical protein
MIFKISSMYLNKDYNLKEDRMEKNNHMHAIPSLSGTGGLADVAGIG